MGKAAVQKDVSKTNTDFFSETVKTGPQNKPTGEVAEENETNAQDSTSVEKSSGYTCMIEECKRYFPELRKYKLHLMLHYKKSVLKKFEIDENAETLACTVCKPEVKLAQKRTLLYHLVYTHTKIGDKITQNHT